MPDTPENPPPITPAPAPAPVPAAVPAHKSYKGMAMTSWILMIVTCLIAIIPVIGFATWVIAFVVIPLVIIFAIVILTRGGTGQGIILLIAAIVLMPGWLLLAPVVSTLVLGASVSTQEHTQEAQIIANLNKIETAKTAWATETGAASGTTVTMDQLTKYLGGSEIKPVAGETYEAHAIGQPATAKLAKALVSHQAGEEITATSISTSEPSASPAPAEASASPSPSASADEEKE